MNDAPRIIYSPCSGVTPEQELAALTTVYKFLIERNASEEGGPATTALDDAERRSSDGVSTIVPDSS